MADAAGKKIIIPRWFAAIIISIATIVIGGMGWVDSALKSQQYAAKTVQDAQVTLINQDIVQLKHEQDQQNAVIASDTGAISDIKSSLSAINEQNKQNSEYLLELIKRLK